MENYEDWGFFYGDINESISGTNVQLIYADNTKAIPVKTNGKTVATINVRKYHKDHKYGYIFAEQGKKEQFQEYDLSSQMIANASKYFGIELKRQK